MGLVLDLVYLVLIALCSPILVYRSLRSGKYRDGWAEKLLGRAPRRLGDQPCVWFHAVSVGEVLLLKPLVAELARRRPEWDVVISTTTHTGLGVARRAFPEHMTFYAPLDLSWATRRATARIRPTVLALVELELWPNLVHSAKATGAAVLIVNGRLSERSYRGYRHLKGPLAATFRRLDLVAAQTSEYALRFENLGVPGDRVRVTGSVKYDNLVSDRHNPATEALREDLGIGEDEVVFVAGSTMEGEEAAAFQAYRVAAERHPRLRLIVVPRHAERFDRVAQWFESRCEPVVRRSVPDRSVGQGSLKQRPVIVIDTLGELGAVWGLADIAFVGGSLYPGRGGQNMLEPAAFGASVLFGPHTSNFRQAVEELLGRGAARRVRDARELTEALLADLENPASALARGEAARSFLSEQNGAAARTVHEIDRLLENILVSGVA